MDSDRKQKQGYVDLKNKTIPELKEILERQEKLLKDRSFINRLPDKGKRIESFKSQVENELKKRDQVDLAADLAKINLGVSEDLEWASEPRITDTNLDSDDDEVDPLKLVATHSGTQTGKKTRTIGEDSLVTEADKLEVRTFGVKYAEEMCKKYDKSTPPPERFKPNEPKSKDGLKSAYRSSTENVRKKLGKHWEITAATPPVPVHANTQPLSLQDSMRLQQEQAERIKEIQARDAMERLLVHGGLKMTMPVSNLTNYRNPVDPVRLFEDPRPEKDHDEDPVFDPDEQDTGCATFYNLVDHIPEKR